MPVQAHNDGSERDRADGDSGKRRGIEQTHLRIMPVSVLIRTPRRETLFTIILLEPFHRRPLLFEEANVVTGIFDQSFDKIMRII
jgi:hypothetical protein